MPAAMYTRWTRSAGSSVMHGRPMSTSSSDSPGTTKKLQSGSVQALPSTKLRRTVPTTRTVASSRPSAATVPTTMGEGRTSLRAPGTKARISAAAAGEMKFSVHPESSRKYRDVPCSRPSCDDAPTPGSTRLDRWYHGARSREPLSRELLR